MCYFLNFPRENQNFQKSVLNICFFFFLDIYTNTLTNVEYWDSRWLIFISRRKFSFPRCLNTAMNSKNYGKSGSLEIIYITFLIYDMPAMFFSILNTWQTLLTNHSFLRQLQTSSQDSTTIAFSHKWFKRTSLLTIKSSSELFISQMRK